MVSWEMEMEEVDEAEGGEGDSKSLDVGKAWRDFSAGWLTGVLPWGYGWRRQLSNLSSVQIQDKQAVVTQLFFLTRKVLLQSLFSSATL